MKTAAYSVMIQYCHKGTRSVVHDAQFFSLARSIVFPIAAPDAQLQNANIENSTVADAYSIPSIK